MKIDVWYGNARVVLLKIKQREKTDDLIIETLWSEEKRDDCP
jgi:hypothetical protein